MLKIFTAVCAASVLLASQAWAADAPATNAPASTSIKPGRGAAKPDQAKADPSQKLICTREEDTGSFLAKRVCRTQAQIDAERRDAQLMEDYRQSLGNRVGQGGGPAN